MEEFRNAAGEVVRVERVRGLARLAVNEPEQPIEPEPETPVVQSSEQLTIFKKGQEAG
jgi:hypothetical protein